jgi:hypothetical protein
MHHRLYRVPFYTELVPSIRVRTPEANIELPDGATLADLHERLSPNSSALHEFAAEGILYGEPDADDQLVGRKVVDDRGIAASSFAGRTLEYRCGGRVIAVELGRAARPRSAKSSRS